MSISGCSGAARRRRFTGHAPFFISPSSSSESSETYGIPLWSTELCCFDTRTGAFGQQYDPTIKNALMMANLMSQGMSVANDAAFHWWVACSSELGGNPLVERGLASRANDDGWNDGLLYYPSDYAENGNQQIYPTKRYYALGNFSRYVRPGAIRHDVTGAPRALRVLAFEDGPTEVTEAAVGQVPVQLPVGALRTWTLVVINNAPSESEAIGLQLQLPRAGTGRLVAETAVETSAERNLQEVDLPKISATGQLSASLPGQSITTYVVRAAA